MYLNKNDDCSDFVSSSESLPIELTPALKIIRSFNRLETCFNDILGNAVKPAVHILGADCGTGKSTNMQRLIRDWKARGFVPGHGIVIAVSTKAEIENWVAGCALAKDDFAVTCSDQRLNMFGLGRSSAGEASVLFTTQERYRRRVGEAGSFVSCAAFFYKGKRRSLTVWDEAYHYSQHASFSLWALMALPLKLKGYRTLADQVERLIPDKRDRIAGNVITIPVDIVEDAQNASMTVKLSVDEKMALEGIAKLAGSTATLINGSGDRLQVIGCGAPLPPDIAPMIVLDASARLTTRYEAYKRLGHPISFLPPATVDYANLHIEWWDRGCGKTILASPADQAEIFHALAMVINARADEEWLTVLAKNALDSDGKLPKLLADKLTNPSKVRTLTWGLHTANNEFRNVRNIIVLGDYSYGDGAYDAAHLAEQLTIGDRSAITRIRESEFKQNIYQAVCRSAVRNVEDGKAAKVTAYFVMTGEHGRYQLVRDAFPGCTIRPWQPPTHKREKKVERIARLAIELLATRSVITLKELAEADDSKRSDHLTRVVNDDRFKAIIKDAGIVKVGRKLTRSRVLFSSPAPCSRSTLRAKAHNS